MNKPSDAAIKTAQIYIDQLTEWANRKIKLPNSQPQLAPLIDAHTTQAVADYKRVLTFAKNELRRISLINHGPDKASGEWRCQEAAAIAKNVLAAIAELKDKGV